jgi:hypothetical protein
MLAFETHVLIKKMLRDDIGEKTIKKIQNKINCNNKRESNPT